MTKYEVCKTCGSIFSEGASHSPCPGPGFDRASLVRSVVRNSDQFRAGELAKVLGIALQEIEDLRHASRMNDALAASRREAAELEDENRALRFALRRVTRAN